MNPKFKDKKYFIYLEHHDDFLFCFLDENSNAKSIEAYQSKKKSTGDWTLTQEMFKIISKLLKTGNNLIKDKIKKTKNYYHHLYFSSNRTIFLEDKVSKNNISIKEDNYLVAFKDLPETAKVWIYQSDKNIASNQIDYLRGQAEAFCEQWSAHNTPLKSAYKILHNKFLVLAVDEGFNAASGCSIDSSVRFVQTVEKELGINFFDRTQVAFLIEDNVYTTDLHSVKVEITSGKIEPETLTFNLQAQNVAEFERNWLLPAQESWMKKYF